MNLSTILDMAAEACGERIALVDGARRMSYVELRDAALACAQYLHASRARAVAMLDVNGAAAPVALFAAAYAGLPYVPLNYRLTRAEINELIERITPAYLIVGADYAELPEARPGLQCVSTGQFLALRAAADAEPLAPQEDPQAVAVQLFTSGTTGKPKAAILRHENLMAYIVGTVEFASADEGDAILVTVPPYHVAGISSVLSSCYAGRRMVILPNFEPAAWLQAVRDEGVSNAFLVPTMLQRVVDHLEVLDESVSLPALRALAYGGGKMPLSTIESAMRLLPGVAFTNAYGLTETSSTIAVLGPEDHRAAATSADPRVRRRLGSVGKATEAVELQIRDEAGAVLGPEQAGLVFVRGPQVSGEYLSLGSQLDAEGWFPTKDRGYLDAEGYLFLDGRADDVIVRGGENISPGEIEEVLLAHPAVADAAVVAMPDAQWGEGVAAAIVFKPGAQAPVPELQQWVQARLRSSRVPQCILVRESLPYNETGKLLRRVIRQDFL